MQTCLVADPAQTVTSNSGQVSVGFNSSGSFVLRHRSQGTLWAAPLSSPPSTPGFNYSANQACLQHDAQLCVFEKGPPEHILWCVEKKSQPAGPYWAGVGDDCSFCAWAGSPTGPGQPHPPFDEAVWCVARGPCPTDPSVPPPPAAAQVQVGAGAAGFPTDCSLQSWQARGFDKDSVGNFTSNQEIYDCTFLSEIECL